MVFPNTDVHYQDFYTVYKYREFHRNSNFDKFKKGNEINCKLIQDGRKKILDTYKKVVPEFIIPPIAAIIIEYCDFARSIIIEED
jgi:hypothetical protein